MSQENEFEKIGSLFRHISQPTRLKILYQIGNSEACVCHLEAQLGLRQAYLSQHLMALRDTGLLIAERDGRFIYYRLANPAILDLVQAAMKVLHVDQTSLQESNEMKKACSCPKCNG